MSAGTSVQPDPADSILSPGFAARDRVRLTAAALAAMCEASRREYDGLGAEVDRFGKCNPNLVHVRFDGHEATELWHVSLLEHVEATAAAEPVAAETSDNPPATAGEAPSCH